jgi:DHA2 family multidrug resistance protein-like MFS transporter
MFAMTLFSDLPADEGLPGRQRRIAMIAVMTATTMAVLDGTIVNIALPQIGQALDVPADAAIWIANGYLLSAAMTLATFAALANRIGYRALFASGLVVFTLASLGCALSTSLDMLTLMRILQGIGGAATLSIAPAIHRTVFPNRLLGRILGLHALLIAVSSVIAPVLGGTLLSILNWRWLFAINVPLGIVGSVLALRAIPNARKLGHEHFDTIGALLSAVAMGALIMAADACSHLGAHGQTASGALAIAYGLTAVTASVAFVKQQRRVSEPLLPLDIFASSRFSLAALTSLASFVGQGIAFVALPFLFQNSYGYSALHAALLFAPWPIGIALTAPYAGKLADGYSPPMLATAGLAVFAIGLALLASLPDHASIWDICWRSLLCGVGFGLFQSPNNREMLSNVTRERSAQASGVLAIMRTFGQCFGVALMGIALSLEGRGLTSTLREEKAIHLSLWLAVGAIALATFISVCRVHKPSDLQPRGNHSN